MSHDPFLVKPRVYFGASLDFDAPHLLLDAMLPAPQAEWPRLRADSIAASKQLVAVFPSAAALTAAAAVVARLDAELDPWTAWVVALARVHGVPDWPVKCDVRSDGRVRLRLGYPYRAAMHWARLALHLLRLAIDARGTHLDLPVAPWRERLDRLADALPSRPVMALHRELAELGVPWTAAGGDRTIVGTGSRRRSVTGVLRDPQARARELAAEEPAVPVYTVTGSIGKTTTIRFLAQLLEAADVRVGFTSSYGSWIGDRQIEEGDRIGARPALRLLSDPSVDAAVLELGRRGLKVSGMPLARTDVAVMLNVDDVQLGFEGIDTVEQMADLKALTLRPARIAVLNHDDPHCRRVGEARDPDGLVWFAASASEKSLRALSRTALAALGVERDPGGDPVALAIWIDGKREQRLNLEGVAPYHGLLGEKTLEELLASIAAVRFGPVGVPDLAQALQRLSLDAHSHPFRTSVHPCGSILFVLDKAAEVPAVRLLGPTIDEICNQYAIGRRIVVFCRAAVVPPDALRDALAVLHDFVDELVYFDRPDAYDPKIMLPGYVPGALPPLMAEKVARLNAEQGVDKPIHLVENWDAAAAWLRERLKDIDGPTLVLINQSGTALVELSRTIVEFVEGYQQRQPEAPEAVA